MDERHLSGVCAWLSSTLSGSEGFFQTCSLYLSVGYAPLSDFHEFFGRVERLFGASGSMAKNSARPDRDAVKDSLQAPTDGLVLFDSISEIVEFGTPVFFASSRCDRLCAVRTYRSRFPISNVMG